MTKPVVIYWPSAIVHPEVGPDFPRVIIPTASYAQNSFIPLPPGGFEYTSMIRSINITSPDALVGRSYKVTGIGCTVNTGTADVVIPSSALGVITEDINAGAAGVAAQSENIYKKITSIQVLGGNATNVQITYGKFGITSYIHGDYNRDSTSLGSYSLQFISNAGLWGSVYLSTDKPESPDAYGKFVPFGTFDGVNVLPEGQFIPVHEQEAPSQVDVLNITEINPFAVIWASVTACTTDSMIFTFTQAGIT